MPKFLLLSREIICPESNCMKIKSSQIFCHHNTYVPFVPKLFALFIVPDCLGNLPIWPNEVSTEFSYTNKLLLRGQCTGENTLYSREFCNGRLRQSHLVKGRPKHVAEFSEKVAPVHVCLLTLFLENGAVCMLSGQHVTLRLLANNGNVPL